MRCKKCNGTGEITVPVEEHMGTVLYGTEQCDECDGAGEVLTNEEYLRSCNTEQLAEWMAHQSIIVLLENQNNHSLRMTYPAYWVEWLKQPHQ